MDYLNGLPIRKPSSHRPSCISSVSRTVHPASCAAAHDQGVPMGKAVALIQAHGALDGGGIERRNFAPGHQGAGVFMRGGAGKTELLRAHIWMNSLTTCTLTQDRAANRLSARFGLGRI
ncbi:MAG: hypothetical protein LBE85_09695, partial [Candidatus Accumulibacter sp.]|nr:hypothetical protein [Accumulibacter sp.]